MKLPAGVPAAAVVALAALTAARASAAEELVLEPSLSIASPAAAPAPGRVASSAISPGNEPRGALFLRADRLEGDRNRVTAEATSNCAPATRRCSPTGFRTPPTRR